MQTKKEQTKEQIVDIATRIFQKKGFMKTSMRDIAKGAGTGVSNIYNYFKNKDELFRYIVMPLITDMEKMMYDHHNLKSHEEFLKYASGESNEMVTEHVQAYVKLINNHRNEFELLLYKSQGSSLETFIDEYTEECTQQVLLFMKHFKSKHAEYSATCSTFTYHIHIVWMFNFISEVIKHGLTHEEIKDAIEDYILFEFIGWKALINKKIKTNEN